MANGRIPTWEVYTTEVEGGPFSWFATEHSLADARRKAAWALGSGKRSSVQILKEVSYISSLEMNRPSPPSIFESVHWPTTDGIKPNHRKRAVLHG